MKKLKYQISAATLAGLAMFNACQSVPTGTNYAAAVLFLGLAFAFLVASNKQETAK